jgi:branched-chain amino acid transport system ATP-binding protein
VDLQAVPGGGEVLEPPGRQAQRRAKADAGRGRAIVEPRELLIVDEPSKGLAPAIINNMIEAFDQLKERRDHPAGRAEHHFAKRLGDTVAVMDNGRVVHAGSMAALAEDEALQQSLLGLAL